MKILLISANTETINMPAIPLGLGCVASALEAAGHAVGLLDLLIEPDPGRAVDAAIDSHRPDVIGISVRNIDDQNMQAPGFLLEKAKDLVSRVKARSGAPVVLGGPGYSIFPSACLEYMGADLGVRGDGEAAFIRLLHGLERGHDPAGLAGVYVRGRKKSRPAETIPDLDRFSLPDPKWFSDPAYRNPEFWLPVQTRRGCPLRCSYCSTPAIEGEKIRCRSAENVVDFLGKWAAAGFEKVFFVDNTFNLPPSYAAELCRTIGKEGPAVSWRCILYPGRVSESLVRDMAAAGCCEVSLGFESGDPAVLAAMNKRFRLEEIRNTASMLTDAGIRQMGFLLLGGPGETRDSVRRSVAFVDRLGLDMVKITVGIRIYPETEIAQVARERGVIGPDDDLLRPRFYLEPGLEDWLFDFMRESVEEREGWMF